MAQHPPRWLASRTRPRRTLHDRPRIKRRLADHARTHPRASDRFLRDAYRCKISEKRTRASRHRLCRHAQGTWCLRRLRRIRPGGCRTRSCFRMATGAELDPYPAHCWRLCRDHQILRPHHSCDPDHHHDATRHSRNRHRRMDQLADGGTDESRRPSPRLGAGLHLRDHDGAALFCGQHRSSDFSTRPAGGLLAVGNHRPHMALENQWRRHAGDLHRRDTLRGRQNILLANDAGRHQRAMPEGWRTHAQRHGRHRHARRRHPRLPIHRLPPGVVSDRQTPVEQSGHLRNGHSPKKLPTR